MTNENISVTEVQNENSVIAERRAKLLKLREHGVAYPNDFVRKDLFGDLNEKYGNKTAEELAALAPKVACAGRVMLKRVMGRLTFATVATIRGQCSISSKKARWAKPLTQISRRSTSATSLLVKVR